MEEGRDSVGEVPLTFKVLRDGKEVFFYELSAKKLGHFSFSLEENFGVEVKFTKLKLHRENARKNKIRQEKKRINERNEHLEREREERIVSEYLDGLTLDERSKVEREALLDWDKTGRISPLVKGCLIHNHVLKLIAEKSGAHGI